MADQQTPPPTGGSVEPKPTDLASQAPGSQVPFPSMVPGGVFSPTTEKQVSDLLAEMQQYASTAAPGTTTTMQFAYQKSKHTSETSGQEPKVVESSHVEKSVHQTPPADQPLAPAQPEQPQASSIFSQIPQFLQDKLGLGGGAAPAVQPQHQQQQVGQQQHSEMSYHHTKKTTSKTTTSSSGGEQQTVTTTESEQYPPAPAPAPASTPAPTPIQEPPQEQAPAQEGGFFAPLKIAAEKIQEQVGHIPQLLQETFGHAKEPEAGPEVHQEDGQKQVEISYQHTKKTTTTTSSSSNSGDQQQMITTPSQQEQPPQQPAGAEEAEKPSLVAPLKSAAEKVVSGLEYMVEQAAKAFPQSHPHPPEQGNVQMEFSKHSSRQVMSQTGDLPPNIETTSSGYTQVIQGIFDGMPVVGSVVPVIVSTSITKSGSGTDAIDAASHVQEHQAAPPAHQSAAFEPSAPHPAGTGATSTNTTTTDASSQLEEQLKKMGIASGHPMTELLQQTLAQHQRAKTPESNIEIQYSAQRTHSSRTVTYETAGTDTKSAHEALEKLQNTLGSVEPPSQAAPEPPESGEPKTETKEFTHTTEGADGQPPASQG